jgi:hypothetical protein
MNPELETVTGVRAYDPKHLLDAYHKWHTLGGAWVDITAQAHAAVAGANWSGTGHNDSVEAHRSDWTAANSRFSNLKGDAQYAEKSYHDLINERDNLLRGVDEAQQQGFVVLDDFTAQPNTKDPIVAVLKQGQAAQLTSQLTAQATQLMTHDGEVGAELTERAAAYSPIPDWKPPHHDDPNWRHLEPAT